jgi:lipopolysaccharide/colanic/teichoic acid biosynthesis glycosyltransferase
MPNPMTARRLAKVEPGGVWASVALSTDLLPSSIFSGMLCRERNRAERAGRRLVLMVLESPDLGGGDAARKIQKAISISTRETDINGWYREGSAIGIIFTEIPLAETSIVQILCNRVRTGLSQTLGPALAGRVSLSCHAFPDNGDLDAGDDSDSGNFSTIYPDVAREIQSRRFPMLVKRILDIAGSLFALVVLAPFMLLIAAMVKWTSPGPVLFRQARLGQDGKAFTFLKFRSMYAKSDHAIHEAFVQKFIANGTADSESASGERPVFKLQADPRITRIGSFLRKTSLDEIPQFFCVLRGDMSLVGPRPPLPYEFKVYKIWHRRRLLAVKPGITGFWQVEGRSRVKFDEMVRMDIQYAKTWSLWKDIRILLKTPGAVMNGNGAV